MQRAAAWDGGGGSAEASWPRRVHIIRRSMWSSQPCERLNDCVITLPRKEDGRSKQKKMDSVSIFCQWLIRKQRGLDSLHLLTHTSTCRVAGTPRVRQETPLVKEPAEKNNRKQD